MTPKPKENCGSSSSTTAPPPPDKRTRDRPNLSDCHCCGRRINHTNPKDRLQPLDSVWRIVLLCRRCRKNVRSGKTCPYCFQITENSGDIVQCSVCEGKIHEDCVRVYGNCTPWCYSGVGSGRFRVCVDCWVPDPLKSSIEVCRNSENKAVCKEDTLEKLMKDVKFHVKKKVKIAARVKVQSLKKNSVYLTDDLLNLEADKNKDARKGGKYDSGNAIEKVGDGNLEIQSHRTINSSLRIYRSKCSLNPSASVLRMRNWNGLSYKRSGLRKDYGRGQRRGVCATSTDNGIINWTEGNGSCSDGNGLKLGLLTYKRDRNRKIWQINDENAMLDNARTSCNGLCSDFNGLKLIFLTYKRDKTRKMWQMNDESTMAFESSSSQPDELKLKLHSDDASCNGPCSDVNGSRLMLLTFKRDKKRKRWGMNDESPMPFEFSSSQLKELKLKSHSDNAKFSCSTDVFKACVYVHSNESGSHTDVIRYTPEALICGDDDQTFYCINVNRFGKNTVTYKRTRFRQNVSKVVDGLVGDSGYCSSSHNYTVACEPEYWRPDDAKHRTGCRVTCEAQVILPNGSYNAEKDRCFQKYGKRVTGTKSFVSLPSPDTLLSENQAPASAFSVSDTRNSVKYGGSLSLPDGRSNAELDRYCLKYVKRVKGSKYWSSFETKLHSDAFKTNIRPLPLEQL